MICDALITFFMYYLLFRMDIMQICMQLHLWGCTCISSSFVVVVIVELESFQQKAQMLHVHLSTIWEASVPATLAFSSLRLMQVMLDACDILFPLGERISDAAFPCLVKGDGRTTDRSP